MKGFNPETNQLAIGQKGKGKVKGGFSRGGGGPQSH